MQSSQLETQVLYFVQCDTSRTVRPIADPNVRSDSPTGVTTRSVYRSLVRHKGLFLE